MLTTGGWPPSRHWGCRVTPMRARREAIGRRRRRSSLATSEMRTTWQTVRSWGPTSADGNNGLPSHSTRQGGAAVRAGIVENRSSEMRVGMLSPSSAAEVCGADEGRYNAGTVLPQGAFDVQSIRTSQTADPRAKQTHPSGPARRSARINSRLGDGGFPGSMTAGRFHLGEVVESFLCQPPLAGLPALADGSESQWGDLVISQEQSIESAKL